MAYTLKNFLMDLALTHQFERFINEINIELENTSLEEELRGIASDLLNNENHDILRSKCILLISRWDMNKSTLKTEVKQTKSFKGMELPHIKKYFSNFADKKLLSLAWDIIAPVEKSMFIGETVSLERLEKMVENLEALMAKYLREKKEKERETAKQLWDKLTDPKDFVVTDEVIKDKLHTLSLIIVTEPSLLSFDSEVKSMKDFWENHPKIRLLRENNLLEEDICTMSNKISALINNMGLKRKA